MILTRINTLPRFKTRNTYQHQHAHSKYVLFIQLDRCLHTMFDITWQIEKAMQHNTIVSGPKLLI